FRSTRFEDDHPQAATTNSGVVTRVVDDEGKVTNYYGLINDILEYKFFGDKQLKVVFFDCDWFSPNTTQENQYGMVEVKHNDRLKGHDTIILAHQCEQVYYMTYPSKKKGLVDWRVVYKVNPRERLYAPGDAGYVESQIEQEVGAAEIFQDDELTSTFNVQTEMLEESLLGDQNDVEDAEIEEPVVEDHARDDDEDDGGDDVGDDAGDDVGGYSAGVDSGAGGDSAAGSGTSRVRRTSKLHFVGPPPELPPESRVLIRPSGKTSIDDSFTGTGHYRQVNMVLGNLVRLHWPGLVTLPSGESVPATTWEHYRYGVCRTFGNTQALVWDAFWKWYKLPDDGSYDMNARYLFEYNTNDVVADAMYYARIQAIKAWYRASADDRPMPNTKAEWSLIYLMEEQYLEVSVPWMATRSEGYRASCRWWASPKFRAISERNRGNSGSESFHNYGDDGHVRLAKRMEVKSGRTPTDVEVYMQGYRGSDPQNPDVLCTQTAIDRLLSFWLRMGRRWFNAMDKSTIGGASQSTLRQHMLAQEDKPMDATSPTSGRPDADIWDAASGLCTADANAGASTSASVTIPYGISDTTRFSCRTWRWVWSRRRIAFLGEQPFQHAESSRRK
ncbi:hypothetical protein ACJX0J_042037, partial [Zea mays]